MIGPGCSRRGRSKKLFNLVESLPHLVERGVGTRSFQYYNPDNGIFDTTGWHYFVDYELQAHAA
jgi:hypothetical protein